MSISVSPAPSVVTQPRTVVNRIRLLTDVLLVGASVVLISLLIRLAWPGFTYYGDNANSFFPLWHIFGEGLRQGEFLLFDHRGWAGANVVGEAAYGLFNPVTMLNAVIISFFDNLAHASFLVMVEFLALLGIGAYMLARVYGAARAASFIAGIIVPFAGFTVFYEAGNWASGLMSVTWVVHFWWAARAYSSGRIGPLPAVLLGGLAATVGNPYAVLGILIVLFGLALELTFQKDFKRLTGLVIAGALVGCVVLFVYLPLLNVLPQIDRPSGAAFYNDNYLSPSLGDLFGLSSPGYLPRMDAWTFNSDVVPSTYLSWVILPLLPWLKWRSIGHWKLRASLLSTTLVFLLFTLGPSAVWMFRWPIRLIEYSYVGLAVLFALLISSGLATNHIRRRLWLTGFAITVIFFVEWSSTPHREDVHLLFAGVVLVLVAMALYAYKRNALRGLAAVVLIGTAIIAPLQASRYGWGFQQVGADVDLSVPASLQTVKDASTDFEGTVLQVADIFMMPGTTAVYEGKINFGNTAAAAGQETLNRYTGLHFLPFKYSLYIDFRGSIDQNFELEKLFNPVSPTYRVPLVDALGVDTLVVSSTRDDFDELQDLATGWHPVEESSSRTVLLRDHPLGPAVATPSRGVEVQSVEPGPNNAVTFHYTSANGGTVLLDRLAWLGYTATVGGDSVPIATGPTGLMELELPPGDGEVAVTYEVPGLKAGIAILASGLALALIQQIIWRLTDRRRKATWSPEYAVPEDVPSNFTI